MKNIKYKILLLLTVLFMAGCGEEWLELESPNAPFIETFWSSDADFKRGVTAIYQTLAIYDGTYMRFAPIARNLKADDCWSPSPWPVLSLVGGFNVDYGNPIMQQFLWTAFYGVVNRANQVLYVIDDFEFEDPEKQKQYKGEALFLRGLAYFHLVTFYENIPLVLDPYEDVSQLTPNQDTPEAVWQQIYSDFDEASKLLPVSYTAEIGRATKGAALGYLGKSYLFNKEYTKAETALKGVIDLDVYDLVENFEDNFTKANENNIESVFEIQFDRDASDGTVLGWVGAPGSDWSLTTAHAITFAPSPYGWGDVAATQWIMDEFQIEQTTGGETDPRLAASVSYDHPECMMYGKPFREAFDSTRWGDFYIRKYTNAFDASLVDEKDWRSGINTRIMRYSEILLMYAECLYENGDPGTAADYITMVRDRADLPDITSTIAGLNSQDFYSQLSHERALEFCFEGIRFEDILRWGWLQDATRLTELQSHDSEFDSYRAGREYFPISQLELDRNPNFKQNTGW